MRRKTKTPYSEKLLDPRWQKFRLECLNNADWQCQVCGDTKATLNVHHRFYIPGREPWEYNPWCLIVLCWECHEVIHDYNSNFKRNGQDHWETVLATLFCATGNHGFNDDLICNSILDAINKE